MFKKIPFFSHILPVIILLMSLASLSTNYDFSNKPSAVISMIGITGIVLFYTTKKYYSTLLYFWLGAQIFFITGVWEVIQGYKLGFGFSWGMKDGGLFELYLNVVPILLWRGIKSMSVLSVVGADLNIDMENGKNPLSSFFPTKGKAIKMINLSDSKDWLLVKLENMIKSNDYSFEYILIKSSDGNPLQKGLKKKYAYLRSVRTLEFVENKNCKIEEFPFVEWVSVSFDK